MDGKQARVQLNSKKLTVQDFNSNKGVYIQHQDGSSFIFRYAFYETVDEYLFVYSEHNGYHIFHIEDLDTFGSINYR
jgi:hypothetical protein